MDIMEDFNIYNHLKSEPNNTLNDELNFTSNCTYDMFENQKQTEIKSWVSQHKYSFHYKVEIR